MAVVLASVLGLPLGAALAILRFPGRNALVVAVNALTGLPPVVAGLFVYLLMSRPGPLGSLGLLFTPTAMVIAQVVLVTPIIAGIAGQMLDDLWRQYSELYILDGVGWVRTVGSLLWLGRFSLLTVVLAGLGRSAAEVGAILIVGGNIAGVTPHDDNRHRSRDESGRSRPRSRPRHYSVEPSSGDQCDDAVRPQMGSVSNRLISARAGSIGCVRARAIHYGSFDDLDRGIWTIRLPAAGFYKGDRHSGPGGSGRHGTSRQDWRARRL
jgi:hypothetical protein